MEIASIAAVTIILMAAFLFSPLGLGGGFLYVPVFLYLLNWEIHLAILGSITLVLVVSMGSRMAHSKGGYAIKEIANIGIPPAVVGVIFGTIVSSKIIIYLGDSAIKLTAMILLIWVIVRTLKQLYLDETIIDGNIEIKDIEGIIANKYRILCFSGGIMSGALGIGGGMLFVTFHRTLFNWKPHYAAGTSYIIETWIVPVGIISHLVIDRSGPELIDTVGIWMIFIGLAVFFSSWLGAKTAIRAIPQELLTYPFLVAVILSLIRYFIDISGL